VFKLQHWHLHFKTKCVIIITYILHGIVLFFLSRWLATRCHAKKSIFFWASLLAHIGGGLAVGAIYLFYYSANDTWQFFSDAKVLSSIARNDFLGYLKILVDFSDNLFVSGIVTDDFRSLIFVKLLSLFCLISHDSYWISSVYFSFIAFASSWFLFSRVTALFTNSSAAAALAFLFFPSVIFWGSGIEKESLALASLYFLAGLFIEWMMQKKIRRWYGLPAIVACVLLWTLKYYWAGIFFISLGAAWIVVALPSRFYITKIKMGFIYWAVFAGVAVVVSFLHPNFYLYRLLDVLISNHNAFVRISSPGNLIHFYNLNPTVASVAINSPWALVSGFFRPFIGEGHGWPGVLASVENSFILLLFVFFVVASFKKKPIVSILFWTVTSYVVVLCVFLALSTPNLGTLSRYRVGFLPFLVFILAYQNPIIDRVEKRWRLLNPHHTIENRLA